MIYKSFQDIPKDLRDALLAGTLTDVQRSLLLRIWAGVQTPFNFNDWVTELHGIASGAIQDDGSAFTHPPAATPTGPVVATPGGGSGGGGGSATSTREPTSTPTAPTIPRTPAQSEAAIVAQSRDRARDMGNLPSGFHNGVLPPWDDPTSPLYRPPGDRVGGDVIGRSPEDQAWAMAHLHGYGSVEAPSPFGYNRDVFWAEHPNYTGGFYNPSTGQYDSPTEIPFSVAGPNGPTMAGMGGGRPETTEISGTPNTDSSPPQNSFDHAVVPAEPEQITLNEAYRGD